MGGSKTRGQQYAQKGTAFAGEQHTQGAQFPGD